MNNQVIDRFESRHLMSKMVLLLSSLPALFGCVNQASDSFRVTIQMPVLRDLKSAKLAGQSPLGVADGILAPGKKACFAIDIQGPAMPTRAPSACAPGLGQTVGMIEEGQVATIDVPKGSNRNFRLLMKQVNESQPCPSLNESYLTVGTPFSDVVLAGEATVNISKDEETVVIPFTATAATPSLATTLNLGTCQSNQAPPTKVVIEKIRQPYQILENSGCTELQLVLKDDQNRESVAVENTVLSPQGLVTDSGGTTSSSFVYFNSSIDCQSYSLPVANFQIAAGQSRRPIWLRSPYVGSLPGTMQLSFTTNPALSSPALNLTVPNSSDRFVTINLPGRLVSGTCYAAEVSLAYSSGNPFAVSGNTVVSLTGPTTTKFFSNPTCTTQVSSVTVGSGSMSTVAYLRVDPGVTGDVTVLMSVTSGDTATPGSRIFKVDGAAAVAAGLRFSDGDSGGYAGSSCGLYAVDLISASGAAVATSAPVTISLTNSKPGKGAFYLESDTTCSSTTVTQAQVLAGHYRAKFRFKADFGGEFILNASASGLPPSSLKLRFTGITSIALQSLPTTVNHFACVPFSVELKDLYGNPWNSTANLSLNLTGFAGGSIFGDPACQSVVSTPQLNSGDSTKNLYWRPLNITLAPITTPPLNVNTATTGIESGPAVTVTIAAAPSQSLFGTTLNMGTGELLYPHTVGTGAAPFSFNLAGAGTNLGSSGLNTVVFQSDTTAASSSATLNLVDARSTPSSPITVNTVQPILDVDLVAPTGATTSEQLLNATKVNGVTPGTFPGTFTRASTAYYHGPNGALVSASANTPRVDHDPNGAGCPSACPIRGLLIESASTNELNYTSNMTATGTLWNTGGWAVLGSGLTAANAQNDPTGGTTATLLDDTGTAVGFPPAFQQDSGVWDASETEYTVSMYVKLVAGPPATTTLLQIEDRANTSDTISNYAAVAFDYTGTDGLTLATSNMYMNESVFPEARRGYQVLPNGWRRVWMSFSSKTGMASRSRRVSIIPVFNAAGANSSFDGTAVGQVLIWGVQLEKRSSPSSYIDCSSTPGCTRTADQLSYNVPSGANADVGSLKLEWRDPHGFTGAKTLMTITGSSSTPLQLSATGTGGFSASYLVSGATKTVTGPSSTSLPGINRVAMGYDASSQIVLADDKGLTTQNYSPGTGTSWTNIHVGGDVSGGTLNGHLVKLRIWSSTLSEPALRSMGLVRPP